jgi:hypothetical protein
MLARLMLFTFILFCCELGIFLFLLPWTALWEHNYFLFRYPQLAPYLLNYSVRGLISGLGLVDLGIGLWYVARFREVVQRWQGEEAEPTAPEPRESISRG